MRILFWNYRGLGGPSTISQLKESMRLHLLDIIFLSETKKKKCFVTTVCKRLKCKDRWAVVDPVGRQGGMLLFWSENVKVCQLIKSEFCLEVEIEGPDFVGTWWDCFCLCKHR